MFPIDAHYQKGPLKKHWRKRNYGSKRNPGIRDLPVNTEQGQTMTYRIYTGEILLMNLLSGIYFTLKKTIGVMMQLYFIPGLNLKVNWLSGNTY